MRWFSAILVLHFLFATAGAAQSTWTPTVDTMGNARAQYLSRDMVECRSMAEQAGGGSSAAQGARGAVTGGLVGAAGGAAVGAALGHTGRGAAIGAVGGGLARGSRQRSDSEAAFQRAFSNCLRGRGHTVLN